MHDPATVWKMFFDPGTRRKRELTRNLMMDIDISQHHDKIVRMTYELLNKDRPTIYCTTVFMSSRLGFEVKANDDLVDICDSVDDTVEFVRMSALDAGVTRESLVCSVATIDSDKECIRIYTSSESDNAYTEVHFTFDNGYIEPTGLTHDNDEEYPFLSALSFR